MFGAYLPIGTIHTWCLSRHCLRPDTRDQAGIEFRMNSLVISCCRRLRGSQDRAIKQIPLQPALRDGRLRHVRRNNASQLVVGKIEPIKVVQVLQFYRDRAAELIEGKI